MSFQCGKTRYRTELDAKLALARIDRKGNDQEHEATPRRAYRCEGCHRWHLTSQERRSEART